MLYEEIEVMHAEQVEAAQADLVDEPVAAGLARTFGALADPTRVRVISALSHHELCVGDLAALLGMTQSAISHQLRLLRDLQLVRTRKDGRVVYYTLDDDHIHGLFDQALEHVSHNLPGRS